MEQSGGQEGRRATKDKPLSIIVLQKCRRPLSTTFKFPSAPAAKEAMPFPVNDLSKRAIHPVRQEDIVALNLAAEVT